MMTANGQESPQELERISTCGSSNDSQQSETRDTAGDPNAVTSFTEYELHKACKDSNYDAVSELLPNIPDIDVFDDAGYTPLHYACEVGNEGIVGLLIDKGANCRKISTNMSQTPPFHIACSRGYDQVVNKILSLCAEHKNDILETQDSNCCTPLHVACRPNHEKCTAACAQRHTRVVKLLLKHGADVTKCDKYGLNPLDVAVEEGQKDAAMAIVKSNRWKDALRNYTVLHTGGKCSRTLCCHNRRKKNSNDPETPNDSDDANKFITHFTTPMRRIIQKMPDVAKVVFDRCCETKESPYDPDYEITYNFEFLEDFGLNKYHKMHEWSPQAEYSSQNHCIYILASSLNRDLLKHPLVAALFNQKWNKYGRVFYYTSLIFYFLFIILLTSFAFLVHSPNSNLCIEVFGNDTDTSIDCSEESFVSQRYLSFASVCLIVYSAIMIIWFPLLLILFEYWTSFFNFINLPLYILTIMFASVRSNQCYCTHQWQWQVGVIAVFLSWIVLLVSIRILPVVILALLLISAFAIPLYMIFYDPQDRSQGIRTPFINPWRTITKTMLMTVGEYEMDSILRQNNQVNSPDVQYPVVAFFLIIVFVVLMPILFLNLLTGLAVGDTQEIQRSASTYRLFLKIEFVLHTEKYIRSLYNEKYIRSLYNEMLEYSWASFFFIVTKTQTVYPNQSGVWKRYIKEFIKSDTMAPPATVDDVKLLSQEVKDLRRSVDQLLTIVKSMRNERQGEVRGLEEEEEEQN